MMPTSNEAKNNQLSRALDNRHVQLMAIGGAIGTGLFMGSAQSIKLAGSSVLLVYSITGLMLFFVMRAMGELLLSDLKYKSFLDFTNSLLGPWFGFLIGWTYWLCWIVTGVADIISICHYSQFWWPNICPLYPTYITILFLLSFNLIAVRFFGEIEFWLALTKIIAIIAIIASGIFLALNAHVTPQGTVITFSNIWQKGEFMPNGLNGFLKAFQMASFSFVGIELAGTAAAEINNPHITLPRAINSIPLRIIFCYVFILGTIIMIIGENNILNQHSPLVDIFLLIGLPSAASIINFIVLLSGFSSANSGMFSTSRMLFGLAQTNKAPGFLGKVAKHKVPVNALLVSCFCLLLTYITISSIPSIMTAFTLITTISAILFIFVWSVILICYIFYAKNQADLRKKSKFKLMGGVWTCYLVLIFFSFILILLSLDKATKLALIITPIWFILLNIIYLAIKYYRKLSSNPS